MRYINSRFTYLLTYLHQPSHTYVIRTTNRGSATLVMNRPRRTNSVICTTLVNSQPGLLYERFVTALRLLCLTKVHRVFVDRCNLCLTSRFVSWQALRKALFKPGAFFKGLILPLCEVRLTRVLCECTVLMFGRRLLCNLCICVAVRMFLLR